MLIRGLRSRAFFWDKTGCHFKKTYISAQQEISHPVLNFGNFSQFFPNFPEISNSGIPVSFLVLGLRWDRKWPVPNGRTEAGPRRGCSRMLGIGNFPDFSRKNPIPEKWHSVTQTFSVNFDSNFSILFQFFNFLDISAESGLGPSVKTRIPK